MGGVTLAKSRSSKFGISSNDKPVVWLHIGHGKTGTTALQKHFVARDQADHDFFYPTIGQVKSGAHHALFPLIGQQNALKNAPALLQQVRQQVLDKPADHTTVMSSEHLCYFQPKQVAQLAKTFRGCNVQILYFCRRQDELIESTFKWKQIVSPNAFPDVEQFVKSQINAFDLLKRLAPWRETFGDGAIHARLYHRETCGKDIVGSAQTVLGLDPIDLGAQPATQRNSLDAAMTRVLMAYDALHNGPGKRHAFLQDLYKLGATAGYQKQPSLFSPNLKQRIMAQYADTNAVFAKTFLNAQETSILVG